MAVDDPLALARVSGVFISSVDDDMDRFFPIVQKILLVAVVVGVVFLLFLVGLSCHDGYC